MALTKHPCHAFRGDDEAYPFGISESGKGGAQHHAGWIPATNQQDDMNNGPQRQRRQRNQTHDWLAMAPGKKGFYNLGNGDGYSVRQVIQTCERITGQKIPAVEKPRRPGDPPKLVASAQKAINELGWKPKFPKLEDIVSTAWEWHNKHPNGYPD